MFYEVSTRVARVKMADRDECLDVLGRVETLTEQATPDIIAQQPGQQWECEHCSQIVYNYSLVIT